jgi:hypothetical protein
MHYIIHLKIAGETTSHVCQSAAEAIDEMSVAAATPDGSVEIRDFFGNVVDADSILRQAQCEARNPA